MGIDIVYFSLVTSYYSAINHCRTKRDHSTCIEPNNDKTEAIFEPKEEKILYLLSFNIAIHIHQRVMESISRTKFQIDNLYSEFKVKYNHTRHGKNNA